MSKRINEFTLPPTNSKSYKMIGLIDASTVMTNKLILNYTQGTLLNKATLFGGVKSIRGHEFHYSKIEDIPPDTKFSYKLDTGMGISDNRDGIFLYNTLASYNHLHFSNSILPQNFVLNCEKYSKK
jgi:cobyrinic acid a,c-diamide synthase